MSAPDDKQARFEAAILPHLDAAYNLARWLTRNDHDAQDVVQDACLRAFKFFGGYRGGNSRSWLLTVVRNTCYSWLEKNRKLELGAVFDEAIRDAEQSAPESENAPWQNLDHEAARQLLEELPVEFREAMILRELEGLSYKEIAEIAGVPIGTVMSRLARARKLLEQGAARYLEPGGAK